jgi:hypothetical protein
LSAAIHLIPAAARPLHYSRELQLKLYRAFDGNRYFS